jgi:hypothetical protein
MCITGDGAGVSAKDSGVRVGHFPGTTNLLNQSSLDVVTWVFYRESCKAEDYTVLDGRLTGVLPDLCRLYNDGEAGELLLDGVPTEVLFSVAVRAPSLDAPPGFCAGVNRASRVAVLHARQVMVRPVVRGGRGAPSNPHFGAILDFFGPRKKAHVSTHSTLAVVSKTPFVL